MPPLGLIKERQEGSGGVYHPPKVDIDQPLKVRLAGVSESRAVTDPGVVEQCIEAAGIGADGLRP